MNKVKGLIQKNTSLAHFDLERFSPSKSLTDFVEHFWVVTWDLRGKPSYKQENLPHPSQHLVIDPQRGSGIFGIHSGKFTYKLEGLGRIIGAKFNAGAFYSFLKAPVSTIKNKKVAIESTFQLDVSKTECMCRGGTANEQLIRHVESILIQEKPVLTEKSILSRDIVEYIEENRKLTSVKALAENYGMTVRSLERLFNVYIGETPKWVIDRYRIIEAVEALNAGYDSDLTSLAHKLSYYDQAHFSKIFLQIIGCSPSKYYL